MGSFRWGRRIPKPLPTDFQRCITLLVANGLFQRENNQSPAQTSDQNRRPIFVVPDLDRDNASGLKRFDLTLEIVRAGIYPENFRTTSPCVLRIAGESFARPRMRCQAASNASLDFIPCVTSSARLDFALLFEHESRTFIQSITIPILCARAARCITPARRVAILRSVFALLVIHFSRANRSSSIPPGVSKNSLAATAAQKPRGSEKKA